MLRQAESVAQRADPPDYVVTVNKKLAALKILQMFAGSPTSVLLIHCVLTAKRGREIGNEREQTRNRIGTATTVVRPDATTLHWYR